MKYVKRSKFLNGFLNVIMATFTLLLSYFIIGLFVYENQLKNVFLQVVFITIFSGGHIMIILSLKKILKSIANKDPFNPDNTIQFKKIGYYILIVGIFYAIVTYPKPNNSGLTIIGTSYGSVKPISFLYLILSILSFILSDVFRMAVEIKGENDLTI